MNPHETSCAARLKKVSVLWIGTCNICACVTWDCTLEDTETRYFCDEKGKEMLRLSWKAVRSGTEGQNLKPWIVLINSLLHLLNCPLLFFFFFVLYTQNHQPRGGRYRRSPSASVYQENADGGIFWIEFPHPRSSNFCQVEKQNKKRKN